MAFATRPAKVAVREILAAASGMTDVLVRRGLPTKAVPITSPDRVYIAGSRGTDRQGPPGPRREEFRINLLVEAVGPINEEPEVAEDRMWEIADAIDTQTARDPEWGVALYGSRLELVEEHTAPLPGNERFVARGHFSLVCHNRQ